MEYRVVRVGVSGASDLQEALNSHAREGWRVHTILITQPGTREIIFEREETS